MYEPAKVVACHRIWRHTVFISMAMGWESQCLLSFGPTPLQSLQLCEAWRMQVHQHPLALAKLNRSSASPLKRTGKSKSNILSHRSSAFVSCQLCHHGVGQHLLCWLDHLGTASVCVCVPSKCLLRRARFLCQFAAAFWAKEIALESSVLWAKRSWKTVSASLGWQLPQSHLVQNIVCWRCMQHAWKHPCVSLLRKTAGCHPMQPGMGAEMKKPMVLFEHVFLPPSFRTTSLPPVLRYHQVSTSHGECIGTFGRAWPNSNTPCIPPSACQKVWQQSGQNASEQVLGWEALMRWR